MGAGGALMLMCDDLFINRRLRRKIPMKMKKWPQLEAVTVTAKQLTFLDSALKMEEKTLYKPWGVSSSRTNSVFLKCGRLIRLSILCLFQQVFQFILSLVLSHSSCKIYLTNYLMLGIRE